jgi:hypothetical protein
VCTWVGTYRQVTQGTLLNVERGGIDNHTPYLIADKCYPVLPWLIPPYKKATVNRTPTEKLLNIRINRARVVVENAFGILKNTFTILQKKCKLKLEFFPDVVTCCCILHNMFHEGRDLDIEALMDSIDEELLENRRPYALPPVLGSDVERQQWNFMLHHSSRDGSGEAKRSLLKAFSADQPPLPRRGRDRNEVENGEEEYVHAEEEYFSSDSDGESDYTTDSDEASVDNSEGDRRPRDEDSSDGNNVGHNEHRLWLWRYYCTKGKTLQLRCLHCSSS